MKNSLILVALLLAGCGKKSDAPAPASEAPATASAPASAASTSSESSETAQENTAKRLERLTQTVRKFSAEHRRVPVDLNELVAAGYLPEVPAAPSGKRYVIDDQLRVQLQ